MDWQRKCSDEQIHLKKFPQYQEGRKSSGEEWKFRNMEKSMLSERIVLSFVQATERKKITYREQQAALRRSLGNHKDLHDGSVLDTLEKGVSYPVMHIQRVLGDSKRGTIQPLSDNDMPQQGRGSKTKKKKTSLDSCYSSLDSRGHSVECEELFSGFLPQDALGPSVCLQQGLYEELKRIEPDISFSSRKDTENKAYIVLGFKTIEMGFSSVLESTWRDWTGARLIYLRLHNEFDLDKIVFYRRVSPISNLDLFMYLVVVELWNVTSSNLIRLLDFVQRIRVERLNGFISLYRDLGALDDDDSNYHSGSQESLLTISSTDDTLVKKQSRKGQGRGLSEVGDEESDQGIEMTCSSLHETIRITSYNITKWGRKACSDLTPTSRVVETITLETEDKAKLPAI